MFVSNIWIYRCRDRSGPAPVDVYFAKIRKQWHVLDATKSATDRWPEAFGPGVEYCDRAVREGRAVRIDEETFADETGFDFLSTAKEALGLRCYVSPWEPRSLEELSSR